MVLGDWISMCERMKLDTYLSHCAESNSKWVKNLHAVSKLLKLQEENILR